MKYVRRKIPLKKKIHHEVCKEKDTIKKRKFIMKYVRRKIPLKKKIHHEVCKEKDTIKKENSS